MYPSATRLLWQGFCTTSNPQSSPLSCSQPTASARALRHCVLWAIAAAAFVAIFALDIPFPYPVQGAASLGMASGKFMPDKFRAVGGHDTSGRDCGAALIDDHTPTPGHARFSWARLLALAIIGLLLWGSVMALL